jgi:hypothetical protein
MAQIDRFVAGTHIEYDVKERDVTLIPLQAGKKTPRENAW